MNLLFGGRASLRVFYWSILAVFGQLAMAIWTPRIEAIYIRDDLDVSRYVALANAPSFESAGWLVAQTLVTSEGATYRTCSGALIAPNRVLTAAHCVDEEGDTKLDFEVTKFEFGFGNNFFSPGNIFAPNVQNVALNPLWDSDRLSTYDMAVLTLSGAIVDKTPAVLWGQGVSPIVSDGHLQTVTGIMVGYGDQNDGNGDPITWGGITPRDRLAATNFIDLGGDKLYRSRFRQE